VSTGEPFFSRKQRIRPKEEVWDKEKDPFCRLQSNSPLRLIDFLPEKASSHPPGQVETTTNVAKQVIKKKSKVENIFRALFFRA